MDLGARKMSKESPACQKMVEQVPHLSDHVLREEGLASEFHPALQSVLDTVHLPLAPYVVLELAPGCS